MEYNIRQCNVKGCNIAQCSRTVYCNEQLCYVLRPPLQYISTSSPLYLSDSIAVRVCRKSLGLQTGFHPLRHYACDIFAIPTNSWCQRRPQTVTSTKQSKLYILKNHSRRPPHPSKTCTSQRWHPRTCTAPWREHESHHKICSAPWRGHDS